MIVADSSSLISLAMNCLSCVLPDLDVKVVVTPAVYEEVITRPLGGRRYALEALRIQRLFKSGVVATREADKKLTHELMDAANRVYEIKGGGFIKVLHKGEADALALISETGADALLMDERTTRLLLEAPSELAVVLTKRTHKKVVINKKGLEGIEKILPRAPVVRSTELAVVAYERGLLKEFDAPPQKLLDSVLAALKYSGCAVSWREIDELKAQAAG